MKKQEFYPKPESLGFYIASNNEEILRRVNEMISKKGLMGLTDMQGKTHYMVDGRRGAPYAANRIEDLARVLLKERGSRYQQEHEDVALYVDSVLRCYRFQRHLLGYLYLRHILIMLCLDPSLLSPMSKTLYPATATSFRVSAAKVERNLRYTFEKLKMSEEEALREGPMGQGRVLIEGKERYANCEAIYALYEAVDAMRRKDKPEAIEKKRSTAKRPRMEAYPSASAPPSF